MSTITQTRLRSDLIFTETQTVGNRTRSFFVKNPTSGESFLLGEEEVYLCRALNGHTTQEQILTAFSNEFKKVLSTEDLNEFINSIAELGFLESVTSNSSETDYQTPLTAAAKEDDWANDEPLEEIYRDRLFTVNPEKFFNTIADFFKPLRFLVIPLLLLLIPSLPIASYLFFRYNELLFQDLQSFQGELALLTSFLIALLTVNLISQIVSGIIYASFGGHVNELGVHLRFGLVPRFYVRRQGIHRAQRSTKLWSYATLPLLRLTLFTVSIVAWYSLKDSGSQVDGFLALLAQAGLVGFFLVTLPIRKSEGYKWLITYFNWPPNLISRALSLLWLTIRLKPLPSSISNRERWTFILYGIAVLTIGWTLAFVVITRIASGLNQIFPGIAGRATSFVLLVIVTAVFVRWLLLKLSILDNPSTTPVGSPARLKEEKPSSQRLDPVIKWTLFFCLGLLLMLPFPYRPGGSFLALSPMQQEIQAQVTGRVDMVLRVSPNEEVPAGTVIATLIADDITAEIKSSEAAIRAQEAEITARQAELEKLSSAPRPEEMAVLIASVRSAQGELAAAKAQTQALIHQVEVVRRQLEIASTNAQFSKTEVNRLNLLHSEGAIALRIFDEARRQAETDQLRVEEATQELLAAQSDVAEANQEVVTKQGNLEQTEAELALLLSRADPQDIEAARQRVEVAQSELEDLQSDLAYTQGLQSETQLRMPFDGFLVDATFLPQREGMYLRPGETFAIAQKINSVSGEVNLPEYDLDGVQVNAPAQIKLAGYPSAPLHGKVSSIDTAVEQSDSSSAQQLNIYSIVVDLDPAQYPPVRPGMTGYAKIEAGNKPLIVLLTRPISRFFQVEFWSWLP